MLGRPTITDEEMMALMLGGADEAPMVIKGKGVGEVTFIGGKVVTAGPRGIWAVWGDSSCVNGQKNYLILLDVKESKDINMWCPMIAIIIVESTIEFEPCTAYPYCGIIYVALSSMGMPEQK